MKQKIVKWVHKHLSGDPDDHRFVPGAECQLLFGEIDDGKPMFTATTYNNDGFELWIAYTRGRWLVHFGASEAHQLARFILWDWWIVSTWCGLKRKLWYWSNREIVKGYKNLNA